MIRKDIVETLTDVHFSNFTKNLFVKLVKRFLKTCKCRRNNNWLIAHAIKSEVNLKDTSKMCVKDGSGNFSIKLTSKNMHPPFKFSCSKISY